MASALCANARARIAAAARSWLATIIQQRQAASERRARPPVGEVAVAEGARALHCIAERCEHGHFADREARSWTRNSGSQASRK